MLLCTEAGGDNHNLHVAGAGIPAGAATKAWQGALQACIVIAQSRESGSITPCEIHNMQMVIEIVQKNMPFNALTCLSLQDATSGLFKVSRADLSEKVAEFQGDTEMRRLVSSSICYLSRS